MKSINLVIIYSILLLSSCALRIDLYEDSNGCVIYDDTRNVQRAGDIDTNLILNPSNIIWNFNAVVKRKFFRDEIRTNDSFLVLKFIDSSKMLLGQYSYGVLSYDTISLINESFNQFQLREYLEVYGIFKSQNFFDNQDFRIIYLESDEVIIEIIKSKEFYVFIRSNLLQVK